MIIRDYFWRVISFLRNARYIQPYVEGYQFDIEHLWTTRLHTSRYNHETLNEIFVHAMIKMFDDDTI